MRRYACFSLIFSLLIVSCVARQAAFAACRDVSGLIRNGGYALADSRGRIISSCNPDTSYIPASVIKIQTALAALHILGSDFRFQTAFFMDDRDNLYIQGGGDPLLVSEEVELILARLKDRGVTTINDIFIDPSLFDLEEQVPGSGVSDNPYDSPVTATGVNFNTVNVRVDNEGKAVSAEPQTPTLPLMREITMGLAPGAYRLNICNRGCVPQEQSARYTAELFRALQKKAGIAGGGLYGSRKPPQNSKMVYLHKSSRSLTEVIASFLKYSNNYIANQVFLACGAAKYGYPATWDKARRAVTEALRNALGNEDLENSTLVEGSGLSRKNKVTAKAMIHTLTAFQSHRELMRQKKGISIKSGTLEGVYNYAGYLDNGMPFVILLNQPGNKRQELLQRLVEIAGAYPGAIN